MSRSARRLQSATPKGGTLLITPASGSYAGGATVVVTIREQSGSTAVNAVQANFSYPTAQLTFQSIDTSMSPFTTTIESTGGSGNVRIGVGLLAGSVSGSQIVGTVTFTAGTSGAAALVFASDSGIAEAATSTNICKLKIGAAYTIT